MESREGFCRRGTGRPIPVEGPKTEEAREATCSDLTCKPGFCLLQAVIDLQQWISP